MLRTIYISTTLFLMSFLWLNPVFAKDNSPRKKYRIITSIQIEQGLPQNSVFSVIQDNKGYVLAGTAEGFASFDGVKFQTFNKNNSDLLFDSIRVLYKDKNKAIWMGGNGLAKISGNSIQSVKTSENSDTDLVRTIFQDKSGKIYVGTYDNGLKIIDKDSIKHHFAKTGFPSNTVYSIIQDSSDRIWIGTSKGLCLLKNDTCKTLTTKDGLSGNIIRTIFEDSSGDLWIGTQTGGLNHYHNGIFTNYSTKNGLSHNWISSIIENEAGDIITGTFGGGINIIKDDTIEKYNLKDGLSDNKITSLMMDHEKSIWVGTWQGGLNQLRKARFFTQTAQNKLDSYLPVVTFEDSSKNLWVGTRDGGLFLFKNDSFQKQYTTADGLSTNIINTIFETPEGQLGVSCDNGEKHGGLHVFNGKRFVPYLSQIDSGDVSAVVQDKDGTTWFGTYQHGLYALSDKKVTRHGIKEFSGKVIRTMLVDHKNRLWIGTSGKNAGLVKLEGGKFTTYTEKDGLSSSIILALYEDREHNLWMGSNGGGLILFKDRKFFPILKKDGLFDDKIFSILEDDSKNLWMSSNKGVFSAKKSELNDFINDSSNHVKSRSFGISDGMRSRECNGGFFPSAVKTSDGFFRFPTIKGIASINPDKEDPNEVKPPVYIENLTADGSLAGKRNVFPPNTEKMEFKYTALSFAVPKKVKFKYKLLGVDSDWVSAGTRRVAYYTNLPSGEYVFKVIAANNDGVWNTLGAEFSFVILPFFYETLWFKITSVLMVILSIWLIIRVRTFQIGVAKKKLEKLVLEKAQELNAAHEELVDVNNELKEKYTTSTLDKDVAKKYVSELKEFIENEKPYLDEDLTINKLAQLLSMSSHHLSQVINSELNQNFYTFINTYRANEVREKLKNPDNKNESVLILAYESGFKSKSSFNIIFKKINGVTPTEFRKKHFKN